MSAIRRLLRAALLLAAAACLLTACDTDDDVGDAQFYVEPSAVTVRPADGAIVLRAVGGFAPYTWSVGDEKVGTVAGNGEIAVYTPVANSGANIVTVTDSKSWSATSTITHAGDLEDLTLTASATSLANDGEKLVLEASGGQPPYLWGMDNPAIGNLSWNTGPTVTYTRTGAGQNAIILTDSAGGAKIQIIDQPPAGP